MKFTPQVDQFYATPVFGIMKFLGTQPDGAWVFDRFEKSFAKEGPNQGWYVKDRMVADPSKFRVLEAKQISPVQ